MRRITLNYFSSALALVLILFTQNSVAEFGTLFTTASERKTIDDNRYKIRKTKRTTTVAKIVIEKEVKQEVVYEKITKEYKVSGISIANNGADSAWINGKSVESGEIMDDKIRVTINSLKRKVRFTVKGGKTYYGQSGDTVTVSYRVPIVD